MYFKWLGEIWQGIQGLKKLHK